MKKVIRKNNFIKFYLALQDYFSTMTLVHNKKGKCWKLDGELEAGTGFGPVNAALQAVALDQSLLPSLSC
jgi:hypothetical protein